MVQNTPTVRFVICDFVVHGFTAQAFLQSVCSDTHTFHYAKCLFGSSRNYFFHAHPSKQLFQLFYRKIKNSWQQRSNHFAENAKWLILVNIFQAMNLSEKCVRVCPLQIPMLILLKESRCWEREGYHIFKNSYYYFADKQTILDLERSFQRAVTTIYCLFVSLWLSLAFLWLEKTIYSYQTNK